MKTKERAIIKDKILDLLMDSKVWHSSKIAIELNISHFTILGLIEEMALEGLIYKNSISTTEPEKIEYIVKIFPKGVILLKDEGGFVAKYKEIKRKQIWIVIKTVAAILNALIIIAISIWATFTAMEQKELRKEIMKKDSIIQKIQYDNKLKLKDSSK